jgi:hypothetical protein
MILYRVVKMTPEGKIYWTGLENSYVGLTSNESRAYIASDIKTLRTKLKRTRNRWVKDKDYYIENPNSYFMCHSHDIWSCEGAVIEACEVAVIDVEDLGI